MFHFSCMTTRATLPLCNMKIHNLSAVSVFIEASMSAFYLCYSRVTEQSIINMKARHVQTIHKKRKCNSVTVTCDRNAINASRRSVCSWAPTVTTQHSATFFIYRLYGSAALFQPCCNISTTVFKTFAFHSTGQRTLPCYHNMSGTTIQYCKYHSISVHMVNKHNSFYDCYSRTAYKLAIEIYSTILLSVFEAGKFLKFLSANSFNLVFGLLLHNE